MAAISFRQATLDDARDILSLLLLIAPEIPLLIDSLEREEALYALCRSCTRSGESWVAVDEAGHIVGFVLVEPNHLARHYAEHEVLELHHAGVAPQHRNRGVFAELIKRVLARMLPVAASVSPHNRAGVARHLENLGFRLAEPAGGELRLRWEP